MDAALISIIIIAIALAMDAFSVSLTKGFTQKNLTKSQILYYGLFFGFFQFIMPVIGNHDGKLSIDEFEELTEYIMEDSFWDGYSPEEVIISEFESLDSNRDGFFILR